MIGRKWRRYEGGLEENGGDMKVDWKVEYWRRYDYAPCIDMGKSECG